MKDNETKKWSKDFENFLNTPEVTPPKYLTDKILSRVQMDLNPGIVNVFFKLVLIHAIVGSIVLSFCPQFGIGYFSHMGIMHYFMYLGPTICTMLCGGIFLGTSMFASALLLKPEEVKVLRKKRILQISALGLISLILFMILGAEVVLALGVAWLFGSFIFGILSLEFGWIFRIKFSNP